MIGLIVARSKNNVIGKNGNIPWKIKGEQKQFRELTTGNVVIMGRKSYEEIGHPLPNRMNIVVSTTTEYQGDNLVSVKSLISNSGKNVSPSSIFKSTSVIYILSTICKASLNSPYPPDMYTSRPLANNNASSNDFEVLIGETLGEEVKYTRTFYVRKNELSRFWI